MHPGLQNVNEATPLQIGAPTPSILVALQSHNAVSIQLDVRSIRAALKRLIDIGGSLLLLIGALPLLIGIAIAILNESGPVLFRQQRIGRNGRPFPCLKFRSMCVNADLVLRDLLAQNEQTRVEWQSTQKLKHDPRISRIGRFLRSSSLDELPQLWNVLMGDMSLVGPRPITQAEVDGPYTTFDGRQQYLAVRPGLTGLWQVNGRSDVSYQSRVEFDKMYVRDLSLWRDVLILWRTIGVVLRRDGAC